MASPCDQNRAIGDYGREVVDVDVQVYFALQLTQLFLESLAQQAFQTFYDRFRDAGAGHLLRSSQQVFRHVRRYAPSLVHTLTRTRV